MSAAAAERLGHLDDAALFQLSVVSTLGAGRRFSIRLPTLAAGGEQAP
ncbi:MAG TPA: hypothetical protein VLI46_01870 [Ramlibacter sp.]|nr:hypothetical protein [Ramlibacter sp.]